MNFREIIHILAIAVALLLGSACGRGASDHPTLLHAANLLENEPDSIKCSLDILLSLDSIYLNEADRHFRNLLVNKAQDKLYIPVSEKNDLWNEIDYFSGSSNKTLYKEALYLQGRMETDKGDFLSAQQLYKESLEAEGESGAENSELNAKILWHLAHLSSGLNHHSDALHYAGLSYSQYRQRKDTAGMAYALKIEGFSLSRLHNYEKAVEKFDSAALLMDRVHIDSDQMRLYVADTRMKQGNWQEAMKIIQNMTSSTDPMLIDNINFIALNIYDKANKPDSAAIFARRLIESKTADNKYQAYRLLASPRYRHYVESDSLPFILDGYYTSISKYFNRHETEDFGYRTALFNYSGHLKARMEAEKQSKNRLLIILSLFSLILLITSLMIFLFYKNKSQALLCKNLKRQIFILNGNNSISTIQHNPVLNATLSKFGNKPNLLLEEFRKQILLHYHSSEEFKSLSLQDITIMEDIQEYIKDCKPISRKSDLHKRIEQGILEASPDFFTNLSLVSEGKITRDEIFLAGLLKIGVRSSDIAVLCGVEKNTVSYRKKTLLKKFNLGDLPTMSLDRLILIL